MKLPSTTLLIASIVGPSMLSPTTTAFVPKPRWTPSLPVETTPIPEIRSEPRLRSRKLLRFDSTSASVASLMTNPPQVVVSPQVSTTTSAAVALPRSRLNRLGSRLNLDTAVCTAYLFNVLVLSLPIVLVPLAVTEYAGSLSSANVVASKVAAISSMASIGGATGKFVNGFVCQELGTYTTSKWYLVGLAVCSLLFSLSTSSFALGVSIAGMEFFASVQCASLAVMLSDHYKGNMAKLTAALTAFGLSATMGEVLAKVMGTSLTALCNWRQVAQLAAALALTGSAVIAVAPGRREEKEQRALTKKQFQFSSITNSLKGVLGNGLFWKLALAYSMAFVAGISDRIMGPFFNTVTNLPMGVCGGLTLSITLGLVHGLVTASRKIAKASSAVELSKFLKRRYKRSIAATIGITLLAGLGKAGISNPAVMGTLSVFLSFVMASNIAYQCYQLPALIAKDFPEYQAVVISFMDGFGYLFSVPLFASLGMIVPKAGWAPGFGLLTVLFGAGGVLMMKSIPPILKLIANEKDD